VVEEIGVRTERLDVLLDDELLARPVLLKVDVQGAELEVLRGATGILDRVDGILLESSFAELYAGQPRADEIIRFVHEAGFYLAGIVAAYRDGYGNVLQADLVCGRQPAGERFH